MNLLRIRLFGGLQLWRGDELLPAFPTQRARSLFAFLSVNRTRMHARELVVGHLWGNDADAADRKALRMALWRVRTVVDPPAGTTDRSPLQVTNTQVGLDREAGCWLDIEEFEQTLLPLERKPDAELDDFDAQRLRRAIDLYRGDLLEDMFDEWCLYERERLRLLYHCALERLMRFEQERGAWGAAIVLGQRLLSLDPIMEQVHRELMICYLRRGSRGAALRQFESCAEVLRTELEVEPMRETIELYQRIRDGGDAPEPMEPQPAIVLERMDRALDTLGGLVGQIQEARARLLRPETDLSPQRFRAAALVEAPPGRT